jgi:uncharacterized repeat protein (TIGR03803 family)
VLTIKRDAIRSGRQRAETSYCLAVTSPQLGYAAGATIGDPDVSSVERHSTGRPTHGKRPQKRAIAGSQLGHVITAIVRELTITNAVSARHAAITKAFMGNSTMRTWGRHKYPPVKTSGQGRIYQLNKSGVYTQNPRCRVNECYDDITPTDLRLRRKPPLTSSPPREENCISAHRIVPLLRFLAGLDPVSRVSRPRFDFAPWSFPMTRLKGYTLAGLVVALISFTVLGWAAPGQKVLYAFQGGTDGAGSYSTLIFDSSGDLYGTTGAGGTANAGTVFELTPKSSGWSETVLYSFQGGVDGAFPNSSLVIDGTGNLYGATNQGGTGGCIPVGCGTVFELTPPVNGGSWTKSVLYSFQDGADGAYPNGVILDQYGNLYGTTFQGGNFIECGEGYGCGTVFELSSVAGNWAETTLHSFQGGTQDGALPESGLTIDSSGNLYGATLSGGIAALGTIYELSPSKGSWSEQILYAFPGYKRGYSPSSTLVFDNKGDLFGTANGGSPNRCCGIVFALHRRSGGWTESTPYKFTTEDGGASTGTLVFDAKGNLYGTSTRSGPFQLGTAYRLKKTGGVVTEAFYSFCSQPGCPNGGGPVGGLVLDGSGNLYGTTVLGGLGYGVVYEITP